MTQGSHPTGKSRFGADKRKFVYVNVEAVFVPTDKGYTYEVAIPVSSLPYFWVGDGHVIGLDFKACDADQVVNQDGNTVWTMAHMVSNDDSALWIPGAALTIITGSAYASLR